MNILVTGGCGYKGSVLVPKLVKAGHYADTLDMAWFGGQPNWRADARVARPEMIDGYDTIIHLAGVANDPCANLSPTLTWECGAHATAVLADAAVKAGVKHFIFASSASVYGISDAPRVTEDLPLKSVTTYNQAKAVAERVLLSYADKMAVTIVRPATVCGLSPRMRLDVAVNMLTHQAVSRGRITVLGGDQYRPNIHIDDITDLYCWLVERPEITGVFNAGHENLTIRQIAEMIADQTGALISYEQSNDPRSYRLDSTKLAKQGWAPQKTVSDAIKEISRALAAGELIEHENMYNVNWMRSQGIA